MIARAIPAERHEVVRFLESIDDGLAARVMGDTQILITERAGSAVVLLASPEILELPAELLDDADHAGLRIGTMEDGNFHLDLQGAVLIAKYTDSQAVRLGEKAAHKFLYGRDISGDGVLWGSPGLHAGDVVIVCDPRGDAIGLGEVRGRFKGSGTALIPLHDLGAYLRDQDGPDA